MCCDELRAKVVRTPMDPHRAGIVTANGNSKGAPCVFPFFYNGSYYDDCVSFDHPNLWCSTTDNYTRDGQWGECLDYDVCQYHKTLSDPWRNIGCTFSFLQNCSDLCLKEGWYRFTGFGGDRMACGEQGLDCGGGLILYYLVPKSEIYLTYHSSCDTSSCGLNGYCDSSDGSCLYAYEDDILDTEESCPCTGTFLTLSCNMFAQDYTFDNTYDDTKENTTNSSVYNIMTHNDTEVDPEDDLFSVSRDIQWGNNYCNFIQFDHDHITCPTSCEGNIYLYMYTVVAMPVGLVFLGFALLTFALCRRRLNINNITLVNLCISLLLTNVLILLKEQQGLFKLTAMESTVLAGILHFLFLSAFVWMFIDAVLLLISAKNLTKIRTRPKEVISWKCLVAIGYVIPLIVVGVSAVTVPKGYNSKNWQFMGNQVVNWFFYGPVYFILALNTILFFAILIIIAFTLRSLNSGVLQRTPSVADKKLILSVFFKTLAQFFILGCPWILGLIIRRAVDYFTVVILVSLQSIFIFLIHCVFNQEVRQQCRQWIHTFCRRSTAVTDIHTTEAGVSPPHTS
ncbi:hypothetical protein AOLI_G00235150 [Acnodon oligacanthus]